MKTEVRIDSRRAFSETETDQKAIKRYRKNYAQDQTSLYKNRFVKLIFDMGHKFISKKSNKNKGIFLDIGCGIGYHLKFEKVSEKKKYICLDIDSKMLKVIGDKHLIKVKANCENIPLKNKSVDVVIASHILEHVLNIDKCLKEVKRVLTENGIFLVVLPCDPGLLWNFLTKFTPSRKRLKMVGLDYDLIMKYEHVNSFSACILKLKKYFITKQIRYYPFLIPNHNVNLICGIYLKKI